jgi:hypothetical protein
MSRFAGSLKDQGKQLGPHDNNFPEQTPSLTGRKLTICFAAAFEGNRHCCGLGLMVLRAVLAFRMLNARHWIEALCPPTAR